MAKKRVGFYGGTFDPVHFGHLNLAIEMLEKHLLDEIWFCPAGFNPHKHDHLPQASAKDRVAMLALAIEDIPHFHLLECEVNKEGPSYTIETLQQLLQEYEAKSHDALDSLQLYLILGDDAIPGFFHWRHVEEIIKLVPLLIGQRSHLGAFSEHEENPRICQALAKGLTSNRILEISSTELRQRLAEGRYCGHLMPAKVLDYIYAHHLY